jgi:glutaredoxin/glutathione-dependent peroxiredoxin
MIAIGDRLPDVKLWESNEFTDGCPVGPKPLSTAEAAAGKRIVLFGLPGAFTGTCSSRHLPGYLAHHDDFRRRGVDEIWCVSVNDGWVMAAWGRDRGALGKVRMLGDGSADLTRALGLELDDSAWGMGIRLRRCSLFVEDGIVRRVNVEAPGKFEVSNAETMLAQLG